MKFAEKAFGDIEEPKKQCLEGTRMEIIEQ